MEIGNTSAKPVIVCKTTYSTETYEFENGPKVRWLAPAVAELPTSVRIPVWAFAGVARGGRGVCVCIWVCVRV